ncbi:sugar ABC transporter ATP-binding protein [Dactylosporangium fulvum]|uniref:Sugar ABC transporter ATP-binding protein n=1 Tax=Dactylosporangium fulvum TaxID=53359 RepID=A0ABY5VPV8_9ACTN|nr:sugar ABC transporter ATP-binding protein [Dactylosporangium fulvum]UWP79802.1 sugar ABC transporter ATP-binding protein [Dactylosporangium fulvum]
MVHPAPAIAVANVSKSFGGITAVDGVSFTVSSGEVVALVGENGAGKSTIKNIIGGTLRPDSGRVSFSGAPAADGVGSAKHSGVATVHQETSLFPDLTVAENILIDRLRAPGRATVRPGQLRRTAAPVLRRVGAGFGPEAIVRDLSAGQRQLVEIAKALAADPRAIVFDEPTASLNLVERELIMGIVEQLRADGVAVLYISHYLEEIARLSQRVVVMRDGRVVADRPTGELDRAALESLMVGRELAQGYPPLAPPRNTKTLSVRDLGDGAKVSGVSFDIAEGEIFGLAGLMGSGRTEVARAIFGLAGHIGRIEVGGRPLRRGDVRACIEAGMAFVTEDRRHEGLFLDRPIRESLSIVDLDSVCRPRRTGWLDSGSERRMTEELASRVHLVARGGLGAGGGSLSGGNQQKVVLGKWLVRRPGLIILDEPTRGIDVGAKAEIYRLLVDLARAGSSILLISSEMEEVLGLSHRVGVMHDGRLAGVLDRSQATQETVIRLATGGAP